MSMKHPAKNRVKIARPAHFDKNRMTMWFAHGTHRKNDLEL